MFKNMFKTNEKYYGIGYSKLFKKSIWLFKSVLKPCSKLKFLNMVSY